MLFRLDPESPVGLADQLAAQVRARVASGSLGPGDRLPPAREVAAGLQVNMHTVLRAYAQLRDEGLLELRRGRGARIVAVDGPPAERAELTEAVRDLVARAQRLGLSHNRLVEEIGKSWS